MDVERKVILSLDVLAKSWHFNVGTDLYRSGLLCYTRLFGFSRIISKHKNSFGSARWCDWSILVYPLGSKTITRQVHLKIPPFYTRLTMILQRFCRMHLQLSPFHSVCNKTAIMPNPFPLQSLCVSLSFAVAQIFGHSISKVWDRFSARSKASSFFFCSPPPFHPPKVWIDFHWPWHSNA